MRSQVEQKIKQMFSKACPACYQYRLLHSCTSCETTQCGNCVVRNMEILPDAKIVEMTEDHFPCIVCGADNNFLKTYLSPADVCHIMSYITQKKMSRKLLEMEKKRQEDLQKAEENYNQRLLQMNAGNRDLYLNTEVDALVRRFVDLTTKFTPCCRKPFLNDACAAITCEKCSIKFCGLCLKVSYKLPEKNNECHNHVMNCEDNIHFKGDFWVPEWYPQYNQYRRFAMEWNALISEDNNFELLSMVLKRLEPLIKDTIFSFKEDGGCHEGKFTKEQQEQIDNHEAKQLRTADMRRRHNRQNRHREQNEEDIEEGGEPVMEAAREPVVNGVVQRAVRRNRCSHCRELGHQRRRCPLLREERERHRERLENVNNNNDDAMEVEIIERPVEVIELE